MTWASPILTDHPELDDHLRILLAHCLAVDPAERPPLDQLLEIVTNRVATLSERDYEGTRAAGLETDYVIQQTMQFLVYEANEGQ